MNGRERGCRGAELHGMIFQPAQLVDLTGYRKPSKQIEWLKRNQIPHIVNAAGRPVVLQGVSQELKQRLSTPRLGKVR